MARSLFLPLIAIARSEGIPLELVEAPRSGLPSVALRHLVEGALRLGAALGTEAALLAAASRGEVWPEIVPLARQHVSVRALSRHIWETRLPATLPGLCTTWREIGAAGFEARATFSPAWELRPGLGTLLAGQLATLPLFHGLPPTRVSCAGSPGELVVCGDLPTPAHTVPVDRRRLPKVSALAIVGGAIEDRARQKVRRMDLAGATAALAEGLARASDLDTLGETLVDVLATYLHFTRVRLWMDPASEEATSITLGDGPVPSRLFVLHHGGQRRALLEVDEEGDLAMLAGLVPWIACAIGRAQGMARQIAPVAAVARIAAELTPRQRQIADLLGAGLGNKEIANALGCAEATVEDHLTAVYRKVGVRGRTALLARLRAPRPPPVVA